MKIAFVLLYLSFGAAGTEAVPLRFATMDECQATFEAIRTKAAGVDAPWTKRKSGFPTGSCVPVLVSRD